MNTIDFPNFGIKACCYIQENKQTSHSCCWSGFCNKIHLIETKWNLYQFMYQKWKWNDNKFDIWKRWLQEAQQIDQNRSYRATYWLILDVMSECWVSFNPSQICPKVVLFHFTVFSMKSTHDVAYVPSILRLNYKRREFITFHWENFNFLRGCPFWEALIQWSWNFLKWHFSKMTTISPVISLLVHYVKIWK